MLETLDLSGAYESVWHEQLLRYLRRLGLRGRMFRWIAAFLRGRWCRAMWNTSTSDYYALTTGVPQGSPLSPVLFILYSTRSR